MSYVRVPSFLLVNDIALSDAENKTSGPLNKGGIVNLPLVRLLLAIHQKSLKPSFRQVIDSFFN